MYFANSSFAKVPKEWNIDPNKIGVMGFSAGGHLVADVSTNYRKRAYFITGTIDTIKTQ
jgi:acetyl esterase/lipase